VLEEGAPEIERTLFWRVVGAHRHRVVRAGDWKLIYDGARARLFNIRTEPSERKDLISEQPEIARRLAPLVAERQEDVDGEAKRAE
jgi:hypothetical protein